MASLAFSVMAIIAGMTAGMLILAQDWSPMLALLLAVIVANVMGYIEGCAEEV